MSENNLNFEQLLQAIEQVSDTFNVNAWVPSKQNYFLFKEIDAKQQKFLLSSAINSSIYNANFVKTFYKILEDNFIDKEKITELNSFTIFDKFSIALTLKSKISDTFKVSFDDDKNITKDVNLIEIIEKFKSFENPKDEHVELNNESVKLRLQISVPTLIKELEYEEEIHKKEKRVDDIKNIDDVKKIISDAFISETSKYIKEISINDQTIEFDSYNFNKKISIIERLPSTAIQKILEIVSVWKKQIDEILTVKITEEGKEYSKTISIDSILFLS